MTGMQYQYIGQGVYSLPEAARLTRIPGRRIRRWMEGYSYHHAGEERESGPVVTPRWQRDAGALTVSFAQLIEIRFIDAFREKGVSWNSLRIASLRAKDLLGTEYPFSNKRFRTDGKTILAEITHSRRRVDLLDLVENQWVLRKVVLPMLSAGLEFDQFGQSNRWWPLRRTKQVVLDPERSFGTPIVDHGGVPTVILAASAQAERSQKRAAEIFQVPVSAVRHAVEFESQFAA